MTRSELIDRLINTKLPLLKTALASGRRDRGASAVLFEASAYRAELDSLSQTELEARYFDLVRRADSQQQLKAAREEEGRFFNLASAAADFEYWARAAYWSLEEAVALAFGRDPEIVTLASVTPYRAKSPFAQQYLRLHNLAVRAKGIEQLFDPVYPSIFVGWAIDHEVDLPEALRVAVAKGAQMRSWKAIAEGTAENAKKLNEICALKDKRIADLEAALSSFHAWSPPEPLSKRDERALSAVERDNMLKVILGVATGAYGYVPGSKRSSVISDIRSDLEKLGLPLSDDTIRRYLKAACEKLPEWQEDSR